MIEMAYSESWYESFRYFACCNRFTAAPNSSSVEAKTPFASDHSIGLPSEQIALALGVEMSIVQAMVNS